MREGAFSNVLLNQLGSDQDARLVRRLVYGTLRHLPEIDHNLAEVSSRGLDEIDDAVLDLLRVGGYELLMGDGAPHAALQLGIAPWILESLTGAWGSEEAREFLQASQQPAPLTARVRPGADPGGGEAVAGIPDAYRVAEPAPGLEYMDPSSVAVGIAAGVLPGMVVADLAAAPGGKTLHLFDRMQGEGTLVALDHHERRARSARKRLRVAGVDIPWLIADARRPPLALAAFDRVLLDAPCTGLGTLRRRPEIRHRLRPDQPGQAGERQRQMISAALPLLKPDGLVVYSVCTVFSEETTQVVQGFAARAPDGLPGRAEGKGWLLAPHLTRTDGMFISLIGPGR